MTEHMGAMLDKLGCIQHRQATLSSCIRLMTNHAAIAWQGPGVCPVPLGKEHGLGRWMALYAGHLIPLAWQNRAGHGFE